MKRVEFDKNIDVFEIEESKLESYYIIYDKHTYYLVQQIEEIKYEH